MTETATVIPLRWRPTLAFAARLRLIRLDYAERLGRERLSQGAFAAMLGVKPGTYGSWEAGNSRPADLTGFARTVHSVTGCDPAWLLDVADDAPAPDPEGTRDQGIASTRCSVLAFPTAA